MFEMSELGPTQKRGWKILVDGEEVCVGKIDVVSKFGTLTYGLRPEGYDSWVFRQEGGGGAVTIPYSFAPDGALLVGFIHEDRPNMGGSFACAIGGFVNQGETHTQAQTREAAEEGAINAMQAVKIGGLNSNSNRAFFVCDAPAGEGDQMYRLFVPYEELEVSNDEKTLRLRPDATATLSGIKKESEVEFLPWREAVRRSPDGIFQAGVARLLAELPGR